MSDPYENILEQYFFTFVDKGVIPEATPLFTGIQDGQALSHVVAHQFQQVEAAIEAARREVAL